MNKDLTLVFSSYQSYHLLKKILKQWQVKNYMSDQHRWKEYYQDIVKLLKTIEGDK